MIQRKQWLGRAIALFDWRNDSGGARCYAWTRPRTHDGYLYAIRQASPLG
jgi:hypothetical protein